MTIIERMAEAISAALLERGGLITAEDADVMAHAALRAVRPEDVTDDMCVAFTCSDGGLQFSNYSNEAKIILRRAIAAALAAGSET